MNSSLWVIGTVLLGLLACDSGGKMADLGGLDASVKDASIVDAEPDGEVTPDAEVADAGLPPRCGDGRLNSNEQCDDGNTDAGDGCDADCMFEICGDGVLALGEACDDGNRAPGDGCNALCVEEICGNGAIDVGEACDDGNAEAGDGCDSACGLEICGDGIVDAGEACDDGNRAAGDGCNTTCATEVCGNGVVDVGEQCDDGNLESGDGCGVECAREICGNGVVDPGEGCDDANASPGDGCDGDCGAEVCGDGALAFGEHCDDGNLIDGDGCSAACVLERCGDGDLAGGEACDDGNRAPGDGCDGQCRLEQCGNGRLDVGEACDDGGLIAGDGCDAECAAEICGDSVVAVGEACDDGNRADADGCSSVCELEICGDGLRALGEACDDGNRVPGDGCSEVCTIERCGDGLLAVGEACDDRNLEPGDGCAPDCTVEACGDGRLSPPEVCDDGNLAPGDGCSASCTIEACGDGVLEGAEACDDGNLAPGDGCDPTCRVEACGNGVIDFGEACDDGNLGVGDGCDADCGLEGCGNGRVDDGESCDDGNVAGGDGCSRRCDVEACANGFVDVGEACDDGNLAPGDGCDANCAVERCGNGVLDAGEACDDGNLAPGDGCSPACAIEACGNGIVEIGEACDDGNVDAGDGCSPGCRLELCGDGVLDGDEACDDGNVVPGDGCDPRCVIEACGNGVLDLGEACDDGNLDTGDGCSATCAVERCGNGLIEGAEACDDGNLNPRDGCVDCQVVVCGDGDRAPHEACDDGNLEPGDGCDAHCQLEACGDGVVAANEACDDGNMIPGDGCNPLCQSEVCGDGRRDVHEACDDANVEPGDGCDANCALEICGNAVVDVGEGCDDGGRVGGDGCDHVCRVEACGNARVDVGEACDDGNLDPGDGCGATCALEVCGNGMVDPGEGCDDGARVAGDGCDAACRVEACGNGRLDAGEACDDGNLEPGDGCGPDCQPRVCGDGVLSADEACDDGNNQGGDGCDALCRQEPCGDGVLAGGEACDDGNNRAGDGCDATCRVEACGNGRVDVGEACDDGDDRVPDGCQGCARRTPAYCAQDCDVAGTVGASPGPGYLDGYTRGQGAYIAVEGDLAVVGAALAGDSTIYRRAAEGWREELVVPFGARVATDGQHVVVGSCGFTAQVTVLHQDPQEGWISQQLTRPLNAVSGFGCALAIEGGLLVVGASGGNHGGEVYTYRLQADGRWQMTERIFNPNREAGDLFGAALALDGDRLFIGAPSEDEIAFMSGAVHLMRHTPEGWREAALLTASDAEGRDAFGASIDLWQDTLIVGAPAKADDGVDAGAAYIFTNADGLWQQRARLRPLDLRANEDFGSAVAVRNAAAVVGAPGFGAGRALRFVADAAGEWRLDAQLVSPHAGGAEFGEAVALARETFIGEPGNNTHGADHGGVWVYNAGVAVCSVDGACACVAGAAGEGCAERPDCGDGVRQLAEGCDDGNQAPGDGCDADCTPETGWDCANDAACAPICGDAEQHGDEACDDGNTVFLDGCADCRIAIGDGCDAVCDPVGTHGRFEPVITSIAGAGAFDDVGRTVATDGIYTAVGVSNHRGDGAVFMFHRDVDGEWLQGETVTIAEGASAFGTAVALHETTLVASDDASRFGVVYLFALNAAGEWQRRDAIAGPEDARYFGRSLVFDGTDLIVGGNIAAGAGRLYRYTRRDGVWHLVERIDAPGGGTSRAFGATLALDAKTLLVSDEAVTGVHVYRLDPDASRRTQTLSDVHATAGDAFGHSLAISADAALIGAPYADDQVNDSGVVHLFVREAGGQWRSAQRIRPIIDNVRINFGSGVALRHGRAIITSTFAANRFALVAPDRLALVDRLTHNDFRSSAAHGVAIGEQAAVVGRPSGRRMHFVNFDEQTPVCAQDGACVCHLGAGGDDCATRPACGDGLVQPSEACDDGNQAPGDGCGPTCRFECGDGVLAANEGCDDGNRVANDGCGPTCELEGCGNGVVDPGEACDDGNLVPGDGCDADCVNERCGDGVLNVGEGCDDGNLEPGDGCSAQCQVLLCGNGVIDADEACDDGNPEVGDGCNAQCAIEACGNASLDLGEACDDGNAVPGDGCSPACTLEVCGSGYADPGEPCDDANADPFDGCHACQSLLPSLCAQACDPGGTVGTPDAVARLSRVGPALQGTAVAIAGDRAVTVGQSVVQAFERNEAGGWRFTQQVETDDQLARAYTAAMTRTHLALAYYQSNIVHIFRLEDGVWQQTQTLQQDTGNFGWAMAFEGRRLVIGAPRARSSRGDVYVYDEGADGQWRQSARLQRQAASAQFGYSVAVRGARILVGAPYNSEGLSRAGRMFIYQQRPAGDFVVEDTLVLPDQRFSEYFGLNAAFSDRFVVGTTGHSLGIFERDAQQRWVFRERPAGIPSGARLALRDEQIFVSSASRSEVDILERQADGTWPTIRTIDAPVAGARFGVSLALSGRALLVGASNETGQLRIQGAAYVFDLREPACFADGECPCLDGAAGVDCAQRPRCGDGNVDPAEGCDDGGGVAGDGCDAQCAVEPGWTCAEVCAPLCGDGQLVGDEECDDANDIAMDGCDACRHIRGDLCQDTCDSVGAQRRWRSQPVIVNSGGPSDRMGHTVAIDGDTVVLGSVGNAAGENRGTAVVLQRDAEGQYVEQQFIEDPRIDAAGDRGLTVAIDDDWLMLGAAGDDGSSGAVYVYSKDEAGVWQHTQRLFAPDAIESGRFGEFLVIREGWALIGATQKAGPRRASAGYLYRLEAGEWTLATRFSLEGGLINPSAVALSAEQAFVSSRYDDQVWVFDLLDLDWRVDQVITNEGGGYFGHSLATDGETLVVGATQGQVEGAVYVYRRNAEGQWTLNDRLTSPDGPREFFGHAVAVEGRHLMVATRSSHGFSTAHHFTRSTQGWSARQAFELDDSGRSDAIGLQADRLVLGVPRTARLPTAAKVFEAESLCGSDGLCVCVEGAAGAQCGQRPSCGDGAWQSAEACEDGNQDAGDGCDGLCSLE